MSDDLVEHLRNPNHAQAPTLAESMMKQAAARIEALEAERYQLIADLADMKGRALKAESRADAAESALAEAVEVMRPFADAAADICDQSRDDQHIWEAPCAMNIMRGHLRTARAFVQQHSNGDSK